MDDGRVVVALVRRQRELNFPPGFDHSYSNTGYTLAGLIVAAVSGQSLAAFCADRIFSPSGMDRTRFLDDYHDIGPDRADSYYVDDGFRRLALSYSTAGATSLNTTVDDLGRWARHVLTPDVRESLPRRTTLAGGESIACAMGVRVEERRDRPAIVHSGGDGGYRAQLLILPNDGVAAILLANAAEIAPVGLNRRVADAALGLTDAGAPSPRWQPTQRRLADLAGALPRPGAACLPRAPAGRWRTRLPSPWRRPAPRTDPPGRTRRREGYGFELDVSADGIAPVPDGRRPERWRRIDPDLPAPPTESYPGWYHGPELDASVRIEADGDGGLRLSRPTWGSLPLRHAGELDFVASLPQPTGTTEIPVRFASDGRVAGDVGAADSAGALRPGRTRPVTRSS